MRHLSAANNDWLKLVIVHSPFTLGFDQQHKMEGEAKQDLWLAVHVVKLLLSYLQHSS